MGIEQDDNDILRSEDEGFGMSHVDFEHEDESLSQFVDSIIESFYEDSDVFDFRDALLARLKLLDIDELRTLVEISKKHFYADKCYLHGDVISVPQHSEINYELNEENIGRFLANEGLESLKRHARYLMPSEWKSLLETEAERSEEYKIIERYRSGTPG